MASACGTQLLPSVAKGVRTSCAQPAQNYRYACLKCHAAVNTGAVTAANRTQVKSELRRLLSDLAAVHGTQAALLPGLPQEKAAIDKLIKELQTYANTGDGTFALGPGQIDTRVLGQWELVYASNGTVVTRTPLVQALVSISKTLPGAGISDIQQALRLDDKGTIHASNEAILGLGPLGSWSIGIEGSWVNQGDGQAVRVVFDKIKVKPVGLLGQPLPDWLPQAVMGSGDSRSRSGADWVTPYVDEDMRLGMGKSSGNVFLFFRK